MVRLVLILAIAGVTAAFASARQEFRPSNLADLVKAVGVSRDGLEQVDLTRQVSDHALYIGAAVGVAAHFRDDPDGGVFVGWRRAGELWTHAFVFEDDVRAASDGTELRRLGRVESLRPAGDQFLLETLLPSSIASTVVLTRGLKVATHVPGAVKLVLPSGVFVFQVAGLALWDAAAREATPLYPGGNDSRSLSVSSLRFDSKADTLTFDAVLTPPPVASGDPPVRASVTVTCRSMSRPTRVCR